MLRLEIARRYAEIRVLYNLARYTVSKQARGEVPGYEASVNQLFGAELHQRLARTGAKAFGRYAELWQREDAPLRRRVHPPAARLGRGHLPRRHHGDPTQRDRHPGPRPAQE